VVNGRGALPRSPEGGGEGVLRAPYSDLGGGSSRIGCLFQASGDFVRSQAAQAHYVWVRASEVIWSEYTRIISVLSDTK